MMIPMPILDGDPRLGRQPARLVASQGYATRGLRSWEQLPETTGRPVLLVNLDAVKTDNRDLLEAGRLNSGLIVLNLIPAEILPGA
jgi:hypothetical protein